MSNRCRQRRVELGLKQYEVAESVGITRQYYTFIEKNERTPPTPLALRIAKKLDSTVEALFDPEHILPADRSN